MITIIKAKCLILGDSCAGKSALLNSFLGDGVHHLKNYMMTLGVEIHEKQIRIPDTNTAVQIFFFDCSGKEFYKSLINKVSENTSLILLVYDVTSEESFNALEGMYKQVEAQNSNTKAKGMIFGNKTDLAKRRRVTPKAANELAKKLGLTYFEGSVKEQEGIETPLFFLANEWYKTYQEKTEILKEIS